MVFLAETGPAAWLLSPLRRSASREKKEKAPGSSDFGAETSARAFDIADSMEKGLARELVADFVQPLREARSLWKFNLERSQDRRQFRLYCNRGEFLMYAAVSQERRLVSFFLYDPQEKENGGDLHDPDRPAFTMSWSGDRSEWRLVQERGDCDYSPRRLASDARDRHEVLFAEHSRQSVGSGVNHCMEVFVAGAQGGEQRLVSMQPVWNEEVDSMVLDFHGRQMLPSAKNFQLALEEYPEHVICQHGKVGPNTFGLDFRYPMTVIQAFAIAMTTVHWI